MRRTHPGSGGTDLLVDEPVEPAPPGSAPAATDGLNIRRRRIDPMLLASVAVAAVLRFWRLGAQSLWDDAAQRAASAIAGTLTVAVMYALLVELRQTRRTARTAAVLVALNPLLIWYSGEARTSSLFAFLVACSLFLLVRALRRRHPADHLLWGLVAVAAFATHDFAGFVLAPQGAWLLSRLWRSRLWRARLRRDAALAFGPLAIGGPILIAVAVSHGPAAQDRISDVPFSLRLAEAGRTFLIGPIQPTAILWMLALAPLTYAAVTVVRTPHRRRRDVAAAMTTMAVASLLLSVAAFPIFLGRDAIGTVVVLTVPVAIGLTAKRDALATLATVTLCGIWLATVIWVGVEPGLQRTDWNKLTAISSWAPA